MTNENIWKRLSKIKSAKTYVYEAMIILNCSFRDIAAVCDCVVEEDFQYFWKSLSRGHRLNVISDKFRERKQLIDSAIRLKLEEKS